MNAAFRVWVVTLTISILLMFIGAIKGLPNGPNIPIMWTAIGIMALGMLVGCAIQWIDQEKRIKEMEEGMGEPRETVAQYRQRMRAAAEPFSLTKHLYEVGDKIQIVDRMGGYELLSFPIRGREGKALRMANPSTGEIVVEGVHPNIDSCYDALCWRNRALDLPVKLS